MAGTEETPGKPTTPPPASAQLTSAAEPSASEREATVEPTLDPTPERVAPATAAVEPSPKGASPPAPDTAEPTTTSPPETTTTGTATAAPLLPPEHWTGTGPPAEDEDDADSALGDDLASSTASISSSILEYRTIQGRRYHSEFGNAQYWGTNDDGHNESLDILHHLFTLALDGKLYLAPVTDPKKVLDVGTGTGIWAIDMADTFPGCEVFGTDVSPTQPIFVPPNCKFEMEDCTDEWTYRADEFDLVHIRYMIGCIPDWSAFFKQAYRCVKPGGYLESYEASPYVHSDDDTLPPDSAVAQWTPLFVDGGKKMGRSFTVVDDGTQRRAMEEAGFVDIQEKLIKIPSGAWPKDPKLKELGTYSQFALLSDVEGFILFLTNVLGWSREQVHVYIAHLRRELNSLKHHVYYWQRVVWGRKPEAT